MIAERTGVGHPRRRARARLRLGPDRRPARRDAGRRSTTPTCPASRAAAVAGHSGMMRSVRHRRHRAPGARLRHPHPLLRGPRRRARSCTASAPPPRPGAATIVLTNGCGGLNPAWAPGTPVLISDHINLTATSPLEGANFVDLTDLYSPRLRGLAREVDPTWTRASTCSSAGRTTRRRPRCGWPGSLGGDLVGMSTDAGGDRRPRRPGWRCSASRWSPTWPPGSATQPLNHAEVLEAGRDAADALRPPAGRGRRHRSDGSAVVSTDRRPSPWSSAPPRGWDDDPDPATRAELDDVLRRVAATATRPPQADLADRFGGRLEFGTAGLRGALGAGPNRMNRAVVIRAAAGLAAYLQRAHAPAAGVVIGYDARHNSDVFARDTAAVVVAAGRHRAGAAPPAAHAGARVRDPAPRRRRRRDGHRQPQPAAGQRLQGLPRRRQPDRAAGRRRDRRRASPPSSAVADVAACRRRLGGARRRRCSTPTSTRPPRSSTRTARATCAVVHTPLHGVGDEVVARAFARAGFAAPHVVADAGRARPGLPDGGVPQPGGAGRDRPGAGAGRARSAPTW